MLIKTLGFSKRWILAALLAHPAAWASSEPPSLLSAGDIVVTTPDLQQELLVLSPDERTTALADPNGLKALLGRIYQAKRIIAEAKQLGLDQLPLIQARLALAQRQVLSNALRDHTREQTRPPDFAALAREHYLAGRNQFRTPEQFHVMHILKKVSCDCERDPQRQRIEALRNRLQTGEDFATLAKAESEDPGSAAKGGDLGKSIQSDQMVAPFAEAMVKLEIGQLSDVVQTEYGFHLIKLLDRQPARLQSFEEARNRIEQDLRQKYVDEQLQLQLTKYQPPADAKFDEAALQTVLSQQGSTVKDSSKKQQ